MNTETYNRLLEQFARLAAEQQAAHDASTSDWVRGFYAGQVGAYNSAITIAKIINGDYTGTIMGGTTDATNL